MSAKVIKRLRDVHEEAKINKRDLVVNICFVSGEYLTVKVTKVRKSFISGRELTYSSATYKLIEYNPPRDVDISAKAIAAITYIDA